MLCVVFLSCFCLNVFPLTWKFTRSQDLGSCSYLRLHDVWEYEKIQDDDAKSGVVLAGGHWCALFTQAFKSDARLLGVVF